MFFVAFVFSLCSIAIVLMCVCCISIKITYLLTYLASLSTSCWVWGSALSSPIEVGEG